MFSRSLQIRLRQDDPDSVRWVRPADILCLRLSRQTLEILCLRPNCDSSRVFLLRGRSLFLLWTDLAGDRIHLLQPGSDGIEAASEERKWAAATQMMYPDPNPVRRDCLLLETSATRDLWQRRHLEVFALQPQRAFLLQFRGHHAYILTPQPGEYAALRDELLRSNLDPGTNNSFTPHPASRYPAASSVRPYRFAAIEHKPRDVASEGTWTIVIDNRPGAAGPVIGLAP